MPHESGKYPVYQKRRLCFFAGCEEKATYYARTTGIGDLCMSHYLAQPVDKRCNYYSAFEPLERT